MKQATLCLLLKEDKILLAMKKRGFGVGRWNGVGGKVEFGEKIIDAAIREAKEEVGIEAKNLEKAGIFNFKFANKPEWNQTVTLFIAKEWEGEPIESEEMKPEWFSLSEIPYQNMWPDDIHWMPHVLNGKKVEADFMFDKEDSILEHNIKVSDTWI
ncbi:MAG: 8-oxo-dGTP diphosphatase [Candidatus Staskawiczbacteria bacterium]|jgi:mutator protein MutT